MAGTVAAASSIGRARHSSMERDGSRGRAFASCDTGLGYWRAANPGTFTCNACWSFSHRNFIPVTAW